MAALPTQPIAASEFFEEFVPRAFEDIGASSVSGLDVALGVRLEGEGGGDWLLQVGGGALSVETGSGASASFCVVQSVDDWRGMLWEGRGGVLGRRASALLGSAGSSVGSAAALAGSVSPEMLDQLASLGGLVKAVVRDEIGGDWAVAVRLGAGEIPSQANTTVSVSAEDLAALEAGELDAMQAFLAGRIQVGGDMGLMMQIQAVVVQAAARGSDAAG